MTPNFPIRAPITKLAFTEPTELPVDLRKLLRVLLSETFGFRSFSLWSASKWKLQSNTKDILSTKETQAIRRELWRLWKAIYKPPNRARWHFVWTKSLGGKTLKFTPQRQKHKRQEMDVHWAGPKASYMKEARQKSTRIRLYTLAQPFSRAEAPTPSNDSFEQGHLQITLEQFLSSYSMYIEIVHWCKCMKYSNFLACHLSRAEGFNPTGKK